MPVALVSSGQATHTGLSGPENSRTEINPSNLLKHLERISKAIISLERDVQDKIWAMRKEQCLLQQLQSILENNGNVSVRTKYYVRGKKTRQYYFKNGEVNGLYKNLFHGTRYEAERNETAKLYHSDEKTVSVENLIRQITAKHEEIFESKKSLLSDIKVLKNEESEILERAKDPNFWFTAGKEKDSGKTAGSYRNPVQSDTSLEAVRAKKL